VPRYISKGGRWYPAKEKVALKNITKETKVIDGEEVGPGEPYIYEGPDRAALFELFREKVETFGIEFEKDPELINRVRQLGYKSVKAYAKAMGYDKDKVEEEFEKHAAVISKHDLPKKVKEIEQLGGGRDFSGQGQDKYGGFGEPKDMK
jgi:hypothetical protein